MVVICAVWMWNRWPVGHDNGVSSRLIYVIIIALAHAILFIFAVTRTGIIQATNQYARQLLLACESLTTGASLKNGPALRKEKNAQAFHRKHALDHRTFPGTVRVR